VVGVAFVQPPGRRRTTSDYEYHHRNRDQQPDVASRFAAVTVIDGRLKIVFCACLSTNG
jgi:hypothetical protein